MKHSIQKQAFAVLQSYEVNIGAGTCLYPDPLHQLLVSPEGVSHITQVTTSSPWTMLMHCALPLAV